MAFTPTNGLEINGNFVTSGTYIPENGLDIVGNFTTISTIYQRAIIINAGVLREILDSEVGTGLKPLVMLGDGTQKQRQTTEGIPLVTGYLRQLLTTETLLV